MSKNIPQKIQPDAFLTCGHNSIGRHLSHVTIPPMVNLTPRAIVTQQLVVVTTTITCPVCFVVTIGILTHRGVLHKGDVTTICTVWQTSITFHFSLQNCSNFQVHFPQRRKLYLPFNTISVLESWWLFTKQASRLNTNVVSVKFLNTSYDTCNFKQNYWNYCASIARLTLYMLNSFKSAFIVYLQHVPFPKTMTLPGIGLYFS